MIVKKQKLIINILFSKVTFPSCSDSTPMDSSLMEIKWGVIRAYSQRGWSQRRVKILTTLEGGKGGDGEGGVSSSSVLPNGPS